MEDRLPAYVLALLEEEEQREVEAHLCAQLQTPEMTETKDLLRDLAQLRWTEQHLALCAPQHNPPDHIARALFDSLQGAGRYAEFVEPVAQMFSLPQDEVTELFAQLDHDEVWQPGPAPGSSLWPIRVNPKHKGDFVGFIKLDPNAVFPRHTHLDHERLFVLSGGYQDDQGHTFWPGDLDHNTAGTTHQLHALPDMPCISALSITQGFLFTKT